MYQCLCDHRVVVLDGLDEEEWGQHPLAFGRQGVHLMREGDEVLVLDSFLSTIFSFFHSFITTQESLR